MDAISFDDSLEIYTVYAKELPIFLSVLTESLLLPLQQGRLRVYFP
jgi:hypothetical protein